MSSERRAFEGQVEQIKAGLEFVGFHTLHTKFPYTYIQAVDLIVIDRNDKVWHVEVKEP